MKTQLLSAKNHQQDFLSHLVAANQRCQSWKGQDSCGTDEPMATMVSENRTLLKGAIQTVSA